MKSFNLAFAALLPLAVMAAPAGAVETNKVKAVKIELVQAQPMSASRLDKASQDRQMKWPSPASTIAGGAAATRMQQTGSYSGGN
jgi:hypothetical protein